MNKTFNLMIGIFLMNKRTVKIQKIVDNEKYVKIFNEEIKKIREIPKMPCCEFVHIGATSLLNACGEGIVDILVVVENLHEITTFDEKRLNNIGYHRIAHTSLKGVIKYARITNYSTMDYDVVLYVVQRSTEVYEDFLCFDELYKTNTEVQKEYYEFKLSNATDSFKQYSKRKVEFINKKMKGLK